MLLDIVGITKTYGTTRVLDGVDLRVGRGEVVGIVGENGAGKTTLMSVIAGTQQADGGTMRLNNAPYWPHGTEDARARGVGIVEQDFSLDPSLTVAQAIFRNTYQADRPQRALARPAQWLLDEAGVALDPTTAVGGLAHAEQGLVEAVRLLAEDAQLVIMDEVAAALNVQEIDHLHFIISRLTRQGRSVLYVSHRLREVQAVATSIAVVREGRVAERLDPRSVTTEEIASHMRTRPARRAWFPHRLGEPSRPTTTRQTAPATDRPFGDGTVGGQDFGAQAFGAAPGPSRAGEPSSQPTPTAVPPASPAAPTSHGRGRRAIAADDGRDHAGGEDDAPLLEVEGLDAPGSGGHGARDVSFTVRSGEVIGLTGPRNGGHAAVVAALNGRSPGTFRTLRINGYNRTLTSPEDAAALRIAYLAAFGEEKPEERRQSLARAMMAGGWSEDSDFDAEVEGLSQMMSALEDLQAASRKLAGRRARRAGAPLVDPRALSGGQQQMVLLGDWMTQDADVLIVSEPGRGLDHDARAALRARLDEAAENGVAVLLVSSDIDELARACRRVLFFADGSLVNQIEGDPISHEQLLEQFAALR